MRFRSKRVKELGSTLPSAGRFRRGRRLGEGAMGVVYEAWSPEGHRIALKTLKSTDPEQLY
ncbi:MAG TPA: hypothetical protein VNN80_31980, partial [Polyangiaceae bacterium]|nr:hypothetical protein [Polyangiaceae bacterium]